LALATVPAESRAKIPVKKAFILLTVLRISAKWNQILQGPRDAVNHGNRRQLMKRAVRKVLSSAIGVVWIGLAGPLFGTTLFDNTVNDLNLRFNPGTLQVGDEINLASTGNLTYFSFEYWGTASGLSFAGPVQAEVKFYLNTGAPFNGYPTPAAIPFYDSGLFSVPSPTPRSTFVFTAGSDFAPSGLPITSSDITWTVQFSGMGAGDAVGVDLYSPPVVGSEVGSFGDYWQYNGGWTLLTNSVGPMDFGAYMATPEPSSMTLSLLGGVSMLIAMRWFRRKE
jgi:hypothetical protein